jgi:hypothetical protein
MHDATSFYIASKGVYNMDGEWVFNTTSGGELIFNRFDNSVFNCRLGTYYNFNLIAYENQWIHVVATSDGGTLSSGMKVYLNGLSVGDSSNESNSGSFVAVENLDHPVWIGRYSSSYANGLIDNEMFFSKELSLAEIKRLHNNGHGTEILAEVDEPRLLLRRNNSPFGLRSRYEK